MSDTVVCRACELEAEMGTENVPHPINPRVHTAREAVPELVAEVERLRLVEAQAAAWRRHTAALVAAMKTWGSWEDGVPSASDGGEYGAVGAAFDAAREALSPETNLKRIQPEFSPRAPEGGGLPRYGIRWNGLTEPLSVLLDDGYWTPWHLAADALETKVNVDALRASARYVTDLYFRSEVNGQSWPTDADRAMKKLRDLVEGD